MTRRGTRTGARGLLVVVIGVGGLLGAACSPRTASSESLPPATAVPPTSSFTALGQTTTPTTTPSTAPSTEAVTTTTVAPVTVPGDTTPTVAAAGVSTPMIEPTTEPPPTLPPPPPLPLVVGERRPDGTVPVTLEPTVTPFVVRYRENGGDPYYQARTTTDVPFLFDVELYTKSGVGWTGQLGTFATDCELNGICVYLRLATSPDAQDASPPAMIADPLGRITIGRLTGGMQIRLQQLHFRTLGSQDVFVLDDLSLDLVPER